MPTTTKPAVVNRAAAKPETTPAAPPAHRNLAAALAAFQRNLPQVRKGNTADVQGRDGRRGYSYAYASLDDVSDAVLPALAEVGLAWHTGLDTIDGNVVLHWELAHVDSDDKRTGTLPVGRAGGDWQSMGSAATYARRYALLAATGVAPGGDDDDAAASVNAGAQPQARTQAPVQRPAEYLPAGLYDLGSVTSRADAEEMYYTARRAGHLNLLLATENGDVALGAWLQATGRSFEEDEDAAAVAAHEAALAEADADALAEQHADAGDRQG